MVIENLEVIGLERFRAACAALGVTRCDDEHRKLLRAWGGWGRHYHTVAHLEECLRELVFAKDSAERPAEIEVALWFHDAVYRTFRKDNEHQSAVWANDFLEANGAQRECADRVRALVMATAHLDADVAGDAALMVDIDLSILGASAVVYDEFEANVRKEYWWVPARRYATARTKILRAFLARPAIYHTIGFSQRYEAAARVNMERAIRALAMR